MISFCFFTSGLDIWPPCITVWLPYHQNHVTEGSFGFIISRMLGLHRRRTVEFKNVSKSQNRKKCVWSGFLCVAISPKKEKKVILLKRIILVCQEQVYLPREECQFCWYVFLERAQDGVLAQVRTCDMHVCILMHTHAQLPPHIYTCTYSYTCIYSCTSSTSTAPPCIYTCTDMYTSF